MKIDPETLDVVIAQHAVLLNRPVWLHPDHRELQRDTWKLLIGRDSRSGKLTIDDFVEGTVRLMPDMPGQSILPGLVVDAACHLASRRHRLAMERVEQADHLLIFTEGSRFVDALNRARVDGPAAVAGATADFRDEVGKVRQIIVNSGYDDDVIETTLTKIDTLETRALGQVDAFLAVPVPSIEKPTEGDVARVEELMRNGLN